MKGVEGECRFEGWLRVYEGHVPQQPHPTDSEFRPDVRWHYGFCVARTDEQSLICYRSEQCAPAELNLFRVRLDGGSLNIWKDLKFSSEFVRRRPFHLQNFSSNTVLMEEDETEEEPSRFSYATMRIARERFLWQKHVQIMETSIPHAEGYCGLDGAHVPGTHS
uniref:FBA_1 domain-containing protein n=1 Tax=Steinernema glaseri TaxID=37863 RepID=A0A1I7Y8X6_9BILA